MTRQKQKKKKQKKRKEQQNGCRPKKPTGILGGIIAFLVLGAFIGGLVLKDFIQLRDQTGPSKNYLGQVVWPGYAISISIVVGVVLSLILISKVYMKLTGKQLFFRSEGKKASLMFLRGSRGKDIRLTNASP